MGGALASAVFGAVLSAGLGSAAQTASSPEIVAAALQTTFVAASAVLVVGAVLALFLDDRIVKPGGRPGAGHVAQAPSGQL